MGFDEGSLILGEYKVVDYILLTLPQLHVILDVENMDEQRRWKKNDHIITWDEHRSFINRLKIDDYRKYFAVFKDDEYIGTINLIYVKEGVWSRGIGTTPSLQGKGETMKWEALFLSALPREKYKIIIAEVMVDNIRSIKYHLKMGYIETGRDNEYVYYEKVL